ncbi:hypothetical protein DAEQUDRAFT_258210 [Daedalea quercina L-15889]|uniref:Uncharacterized protein n=1 Tax=Daedalea quercina L-15889 TaxID=1314783 RepID=A0A165QJU8_9APHY|nr:hypothetical protein DAEQUDRAFT_258210 [Daedalea quercina L-15889]
MATAVSLAPRLHPRISPVRLRTRSSNALLRKDEYRRCSDISRQLGSLTTQGFIPQRRRTSSWRSHSRTWSSGLLPRNSRSLSTDSINAQLTKGCSCTSPQSRSVHML